MIRKCQNGVGTFKKLRLKNYWYIKAEMYMKAFQDSIKIKFVKIVPPRVGMGPQ
jgi:hypothetical protein